MAAQPVRVVFDCNIFLQAMISETGPAARFLEYARRGMCRLFISDYVLSELRDLPNDRELSIRLAITTDKVERLVTELLEIAEFVSNVPVVYVHPHDPDDSHYVNLAAATNSRLIVSRDRHLLKLMDDRRREAQEFRKLFPWLRVLDPPAFLRELDQEVQAQPEGEGS
jgi:putative PIN family toxin of toxin-antitoxin system